MDTLLLNGDHMVDSRGLPVCATGHQEIMQRAMIRLTVKRGSFLPSPRLGSELHLLRPFGAEGQDRLALSYVQEALAPMREIEVLSVTCRQRDRDTLSVCVKVAVEDSAYWLEMGVRR